VKYPLLPIPRYAGDFDFCPSVHWARIQQAYPTPGTSRRIMDYELFYIIRGKILVHFEHVEAKAIRSVSGDLLLLPPAIAHRIELLTEPNTLLLGIHFDFFNEIDTSVEQDLVVHDPEPRQEMFCKMPVNEDGSPLFQRFYPSLPPGAADWMHRLIAEYGSAQPGSTMVCRGLLLQLLALLLRLHARPDHRAHPEYRTEVMALAAEMDASLGQPWTNASMARRLGVSEDHFIRLFRDIVGLSPNKYLLSSRHREAKRLLLETSLSIEAIGRELGYEQLANFSKSFKKWQGVSPREYRRLSILY
jgi:AraC-like DNA-binding protein